MWKVPIRQTENNNMVNLNPINLNLNNINNKLNKNGLKSQLKVRNCQIG